MSQDFPAHLAGFRVGSLLAGYRLEVQVGAGGMALTLGILRGTRLDRVRLPAHTGGADSPRSDHGQKVTTPG